MAVGLVDKVEVLWRSVRPEEVTYPNGTLKISATAFNDLHMKPSVDRRILRRDPVETRKGDNDGVAQIITADVRSITVQVNPNEKDVTKKKQVHKVDVLARPIPADNLDGEKENPSHAQVEVAPDYINVSRFNKVKDALARLAQSQGWVIEPKTKPQA